MDFDEGELVNGPGQLEERKDVAIAAVNEVEPNPNSPSSYIAINNPEENLAHSITHPQFLRSNSTSVSFLLSFLLLIFQAYMDFWRIC